MVKDDNAIPPPEDLESKPVESLHREWAPIEEDIKKHLEGHWLYVDHLITLVGRKRKRWASKLDLFNCVVINILRTGGTVYPSSKPQEEEPYVVVDKPLKFRAKKVKMK